MKIIEKGIKISDLKPGDTFRFNGEIYLRTTDWFWNAVCITNGVLRGFHEDDYVQKVDGSFVIER